MMHRRRSIARRLAAACVGAVAAAGVHAGGQAGLTLLDAAQTTLAEQPQINAQREQVTVAQGALQAVTGRFDMRLRGSADTGHSPLPLRVQDEQNGITSTVTNTTDFYVGFDQPLRTGLIISPTIGVSRLDRDFDPLATNRASVGLAITQPLVRGRGVDVVTAPEVAARYELSATNGDLLYTASAGVYNTAVAYWTYLAAYRTLDIAQTAEGRARRGMEEMQTLIDAGNRPAADIREMSAYLSERLALLSSSEQSVFEARQALGIAMGIPADRTAALGAPTDDFPPLPEGASGLSDAALLDMAIASRGDLEATRQRELETQVLIVPARDQLKPQVDLSVSAGYAGLTEGAQFPGLFTAIGSRGTGPNLFASVVVSQAKDTNTARGQLLQTEAAHRQTVIQRDNLARTIRSNVVVAEQDLVRSLERARYLRDAVTMYGQAVDDERQKLQLGRSTTVELIAVEDRLTNNRLNEVQAMLSYAAALARLRLETGTLVGGSAPTFQVTADALRTIPDTGGR